MSRKSPNDFALWQWVLIGSVATLILSLAGYGVFSLMNNPKGLSANNNNNVSPQSKSPDANFSSPPNNSPNDGSPSVLNAPISGTWLVEGTGFNTGNQPIEVVITNEGKLILIDPISPSTAIEIIKLIKKISDSTSIPSERDVILFSEAATYPAMKQKQNQAKNYTGAMNRGQQAFYLEKLRFAASVAEIGVGINTNETPDYNYKVSIVNDSNPLRRGAFHIVQSRQEGLRSYVGAVRIVKLQNDITTIAILCESNSRGKVEVPLPFFVSDDKLECASGTRQPIN